MEEQRDGCHVDASRKQVAHPVRIAHEQLELGILRIVPVRPEVRRTIPVWERRGVERMGYELVHAAHQHVVADPLGKTVALCPAVGTKDLRHAAAALLGVEVREGPAKLAKQVGEEFAIPTRLMECLVHPLVLTGHQLLDDDVDACHVGIRHGTVEVACSVAQTSARVIVLDRVADVLDRMSVAPGRYDLVEVL